MFNWIGKKPEVKESPVGGAYAVNMPLGYNQSNDKKKLAKEGYARNVIVYRAIKEITTACASIRIQQKQGQDVLKKSPILDLLKRPNPSMGFDSFIEQIFTDYLITGELAIVGDNERRSTELWPANPLYLQVKPGDKGFPLKYVYDLNNYKREFLVDQVNGDCQLFHFKSYNPLDYWRGMSPLEAAALAGDTHNAGMVWNYSLLKNGARPSGLVRFKDSPSDEVISRLKEYFKRTLQGSKNSGELPVLTDDAEWVSMDQSPRDMDYLSTMKETSKYVASAFGVPLALVDNDASTFNNLEQSKERLWTDTVLPLFNKFLNAFEAWLSQHYDADIDLCINMDAIPALEGIRKEKYDRTLKAFDSGLISTHEAREDLGYTNESNIPDVLLVPNSKIPLELLQSSLTDEELSEKMASLGYSQKDIDFALETKNAD